MNGGLTCIALRPYEKLLDTTVYLLKLDTYFFLGQGQRWSRLNQA